MCFVIDETKKSSNRRIGWKVVRLNNKGYLNSQVYTCAGPTWQPGEVVHKSSGPTTHRADHYIVDNGRRYKPLQSTSGIYVYTSKKWAMESKGNPNYSGNRDLFLLRVRVSPNDFLHESKKGDVATYSRVTPCEEQPDFDWY